MIWATIMHVTAARQLTHLHPSNRQRPLSVHAAAVGAGTCSSDAPDCPPLILILQCELSAHCSP